jgi:hypothetical protein
MTRKWKEGINGPAMDKFMDDLRSGKYEQAIGVLNSTKGMCCLGVATHGAMDACGITYQNHVYFDQDSHGFDTLPPIEVLEYLGIPKTHRKSTLGKEYNVALLRREGEYLQHDLDPNLTWATYLNDSKQLSFVEIADRFEETFMEEV